MSEHPYTDDDYEDAIALALSERNMQAVESLLTSLAVRNPGRAQLVMGTIRFGLHLMRAEKP